MVGDLYRPYTAYLQLLLANHIFRSEDTSIPLFSEMIMYEHDSITHYKIQRAVYVITICVRNACENVNGLVT